MSENQWVLLFVELLISVSLPVIMIEIARYKGRETVQNFSSRSVLLSYLTGVALLYNGSAVVFLLAMIPAIITTLVAIPYRKMVTRQVTEQLALAPQVVRYGLANFDALAAPDGETISSGALHSALDEERIAPADRELVEHMAARISEIGHVTGVSYVSAGFHPSGAVLHVYGISREDLETYEDRMRSSYAAWL